MIPSNQFYPNSDITPARSLDSWISSLFTSCQDAIIACDLNGDICAWNNAAHRIFAISPKQSLGKNLNRLFLNSFTTASVSAPGTAADDPTLQSSFATAGPPTAASIPSDSELYPSTPEK
ncbi:hypothetical protein BGZ80_003593, partial [Entomortierella chlamydospora]